MISVIFKKISLFIFLLVLCNVGCSSEPTKKITDEFDSLSSSQGKKLLVIELTKLNEWIVKKQKVYDSSDAYIFQNTLVKDLYGNPYSYFLYAKEVVGDDGVDVEVKKLVIKLSQCLKLNDYLDLGGAVIGTGDGELMTVYVSPGSEYGVVLDENYLDKNVVSFLGRVVSKYPSLSEVVELTSSGININRINAYRKSGEVYPVIQCPKH